MSNRIGVTFTAIGGSAAGLGRTASGKTMIADRPEGRAGGMGLGCNGAELLSSALGGCFWNDLHYAADAAGIAIRVDRIEADVTIAGNPGRVAAAHITATLSGNDAASLRRVFQTATEQSTIANSLTAALPTTFDLISGDTT